MAHADPGDRGRRRAAPHTPETAGLERLRSWACLDADSVPHACPNFSDTVVLGSGLEIRARGSCGVWKSTALIFSTVGVCTMKGSWAGVEERHPRPDSSAGFLLLHLAG